MFDFKTGALRPLNDDARAKRLVAARELVTRTLARHGLFSRPGHDSPRPPATKGARDLGDRFHIILGKGAAQSRNGGSITLEVPQGAQFLSATHQARSGRRGYRTYVPASAEKAASGIVMMLHGCTQTAEDFAIGTGMNDLAERHGFIVIYPEQSRGANAQTCWNWFSPNDQSRERGEPEILAAIAKLAVNRYGVPPGRTFVAGLSAGAAMAVILGQTHPDVFAAVGAHSGLPYRAARDVASAFAAMAGQQERRGEPRPQLPGVRTIVFHGAADGTVHPSNGETIALNAERFGPMQSLQATRRGEAAGRAFAVTTSVDANGRNYLEHWTVDGLGHAWSGGRPGGSYTDARGPDASAEMIRFFFEA